MFHLNIQKIGKKMPFKNQYRVIRRSGFFVGRLLGLLLAGAVTPVISFADFQCKASISYGWQRGESAEQTTFFSGAEGVAATEEAARVVLAERTSREEPKAIAECRRLHENLSQCVATKYASLGGVLGSMSFSSRKSLEDSINKDCMAAQGVCTGSKLSEVKCQERKAPEAAAQPAPGGDATGGAAGTTGDKGVEAEGKKEEAAKK
jgi:hypothetical protein